MYRKIGNLKKYIGDGKMNNQPIRVSIGRDVKLTSPGMLGRTFDFKSGYSFLTEEWHYPGELYQNGTLTGKPRAKWSFGTNTQTNLPLYFDAQDVCEVFIPNDLETMQIFNGTPFKVNIIDQDPCK
jgi:hypothetical protein